MEMITKMLADLRQAGYICPSPDGKKILYGVSGADLAGDKNLLWLWLYDIEKAAHRQLTFTGSQRPSGWMGNDAVICAEDGEKSTRFFALPIAGGGARPLFELPHPGASAVHLEGERFILSAVRDVSDPADGNCGLYEIYDEYPYHADGRGYVNKKRSCLWLWDGGELIEITDKYFQANQVMNSRIDIIVSPDKKRVYYSGERVDTLTSPTQDVYLYDVDGRKSELLFKNGRHQLMQGFEFDGRVYFTGYAVAPDTGDEFFSVEVISSAPGEGKYRVELSPDETVGGLYPAGDHMLLILCEHDRSNVYRWLPGQKPERICSPAHFIQSGLFPCADGIYYTGTAPMGAREVCVIKDGESRALTCLSDALSGYELSPNEPVSVKCAGGHTVYGWVSKPHGYVPGKKYPGILIIHGGPQSAFLDTLDVSRQRYCAAGYFVFFCNPRGSTNYGRAFMDLQLKFGTIDYNDLMDFTDEVLKQYPDIDPGRLGVTGGSYGGYMSNWIIGRTDRFRAAVPQRSISNWISMYGCTDISYFVRWGQGGTPWGDLETLWDHSPLKYADNFKTPTLLIQNDRDYRCPVEQAEQMLTALLEHNVPCRMVLFKGASHSVMKPSQIIKKDREVIAWFDKYLKGE